MRVFMKSSIAFRTTNIPKKAGNHRGFSLFFGGLMDLHTSATMYPAISEADLLALPIPSIAPEAQQQVQKSVQQANPFRQQTARLLDAARRAVEIAIEDSEAAALAWLQSV